MAFSTWMKYEVSAFLSFAFVVFDGYLNISQHVSFGRMAWRHSLSIFRGSRLRGRFMQMSATRPYIARAGRTIFAPRPLQETCIFFPTRKTSGGDCRRTIFLLSFLPFSDSGTAEPFFLIISVEGRPFGQATRPPQCDLRPFLRCCLLPSRDRPCFSGQGVPWKYKRLECPLSLLVPLR